MRRLLLIAAASIFTSGCTYSLVSAPTVPLIGGEMESTKFRSEIEMGPVVTGEATAFAYFGFLRGGPTQLAGDQAATDPVSRARGGALFSALATGNGDVLIAPKYETSVSTSLFGTSATVRVTGRIGKVKGISPAP